MYKVGTRSYVHFKYSHDILCFKISFNKKNNNQIFKQNERDVEVLELKQSQTQSTWSTLTYKCHLHYNQHMTKYSKKKFIQVSVL